MSIADMRLDSDARCYLIPYTTKWYAREQFFSDMQRATRDRIIKWLGSIVLSIAVAWIGVPRIVGVGHSAPSPVHSQLAQTLIAHNAETVACINDINVCGTVPQ